MRFCWPQWIFIVVVIFLGIGSMLSGCGQKGPLYLQKTEQEKVEQGTEPSVENTSDAEEKQKKNKSD